MIYIGIDNGVTGSIGVIDNKLNQSFYYKMPVFTEQSYTKAKQMISRIDHIQLVTLMTHEGRDVKVLLERPMVNPTRFKASASALRALESTLLVIEAHGYPYSYLDSKEWQRVLLPKGVKGTKELKKASLDIGCRLFPQHKELIVKRKDADSLLIAEFARIKN